MALFNLRKSNIYEFLASSKGVDPHLSTGLIYKFFSTRNLTI